MEVSQNWLFREAMEEKSIALYLLRRLRESPVLLAYLIVGTIVAVIEFGVTGLVDTAINWLILGAFAVLIFRMTEKRAAEVAPVRRPKGELVAGIAFYGLDMLLLVLFWGLFPVPLVQGGFTSFMNTVGGSALNFFFFHGGTQTMGKLAYNAAESAVTSLLPTLILFFACGYGARGMGLRFRRQGKTIAAVLIFSFVPSLLLMWGHISLFAHPFLETLALFGLQMLINGLPEELFCRGFLLPRLERVLKNPVNALVLTSILFNASHIPKNVAEGHSLPMALLSCLSAAFPSGLLWGYLYQRTRSIVPGVLLHTFDSFVPYLV